MISMTVNKNSKNKKFATDFPLGGRYLPLQEILSRIQQTNLAVGSAVDYASFEYGYWSGVFDARLSGMPRK